MKILWVSGWAIPQDWFAQQLDTYMPHDQHEIILPVSNWFRELQEKISFADQVAGYSFGAFLLLGQSRFLNEAGKPVRLYAPFLDFKAESGLGSKISLTQLKYLKRWLNRKPLEAIADFYKQAEIEITPLNGLPYPLNELDWGVDRMIEDEIKLPIEAHNIMVISGNYDKLIFIDLLRGAFENLSCKNCNHSISNLLIENSQSHA